MVRLHSGRMRASLAVLRFGLFVLHLQADGQTVSPVQDENSCLDRCSESYFPGKPCYCNDACDQYENCCYDFYQQCKPDFIWTDEWVDYETHSYKYFDDLGITAEEADEKCRQHGALLVSINSEQEQEFIVLRVLRMRTLSAFIGASDAEEESNWHWLDGTRMPLPTDPWHSWYKGQPDNEGGLENCALITNYNYWSIRKLTMEKYTWRDYVCQYNEGQEVQGYICERTLLCEPNPCVNNGSCAYVGGDDELTCVCPQGFLGERCEYEVGEGVWTRCGETHLMEERGQITSPLYPRDYPANAHCQWLIEAANNLTLALSFTSFAIEEVKNCVFDSITIYDGSSVESPLLFGPACGEDIPSQGSNKSMKDIISSGNSVLVIFTSDDSMQKPGFRLNFEQQKCGLGVGDSGCGTRRMFESQCGSIDVVTGPTFGETCDFFIRVEKSLRLKLKFLKFRLADMGMGCVRGSLSVYSGSDATGHLVGKFCGRRFPFQLISHSNEIYIQLENIPWKTASDSLEFQYETFDPSVTVTGNAYTELSGRHISLSTLASPVNIQTSNVSTYRWLLKVPHGEQVRLAWTLENSINSSLKIFGGFIEESGLLYQIQTTSTSYKTISHEIIVKHTFQILVVLHKGRSQDYDMEFSAELTSVEWHPVYSGCYRPLFFSNTSSGGTENNLITHMEPVALMVSAKAFDKNKPGYENGVYCKWLLEGEEASNLRLRVINASVFPVTESCDYDGLVVYDGRDTTGKKYGPFCGSVDLKSLDVKASSNHFLVVFYSDRSGGWRDGGLVQAIVTAEKTGEEPWPVFVMDKQTERLLVPRGVLLSPGFPGLVRANKWNWLLQGPEGAHFTLYIHYIRGPAVPDDCDQFFRLVEVSKDANQLSQYEANMFNSCGDTDLFFPPKRIRGPPDSKVAVRLNTLASAIMNRWEFKMSFLIDYMEPPVNFNVSGPCPSNYYGYGDYCYRYYFWAGPHYLKEYAFQETWQTALSQCEKENGTLASIHSEEEAYWIKYMLAQLDVWLWDPAGTYQVNHRLIYIGLNNRHDRYQWSDGSSLAYSDWYYPPEGYEQYPLPEGSTVKDLLYMKNPQPTADAGSLCTVLLVTSPFGSLNWAKLPCDYPVFRAGVLCKLPVPLYSTEKLQASTNAVLSERAKIFQTAGLECENGWFSINGRCRFMLPNRLFGEEPSKENVSSDNTCAPLGAIATPLQETETQILRHYLTIWRHQPADGNIVIGVGENCQLLKVSKKAVQDEIVSYTVLTQDCLLTAWNAVGFVLCTKDPTVVQEKCGAHEFRCSNEMCVGSDYVCDGHDDCGDNSDEASCDCSPERFQCDNGRCISVSLYCDFRDDCGDNTDEKNCILEVCRNDQFTCNNGQCVDQNKMCDFRLTCADGSDEGPNTCENRCSGFLCYSGRCIHPSLQLDAISDCPGLSLEDEEEQTNGCPAHPELLSLQMTGLFDLNHDSVGAHGKGTLESRPEQQGGLVQCQPGQSRYYQRDRACVYDTRVVDEFTGFAVQDHCRDGAHLRKYCASMDCLGMFHCPGSYCLPRRKVCNGLVECPGGEDERDCQSFICPGHFRCKFGSYCLKHSEICDGIIHCPVHGEDEKYCGKLDFLCDVGECFGTVADLSNRSLDMLPTPASMEPRRLRALFLQRNNLQLQETYFRGLMWLGKLNISHNMLVTLPLGIFNDLVNLYELDLSNNLLSELHPDIYMGLSSLRTLLLNSNMLKVLSKLMFIPVPSITHLVLNDNVLDDVQPDTFAKSHNLKVLNTDAYKFCCIAEHVKECTPEADEFSSCQDLMANFQLQISIWVLGIFAFVGNFFVVAWRLKTDRNKASSFFIINLGMSDFLMGGYMLIIASVDVYYRGVYIVYADYWTSSHLCQFAGFLAMLSSETSVYMLTAITLDRALSILYPLKFGHVRMKYARFVALTGWIGCFVLSILPMTRMSYFGTTFFGRSGVCLPFQISNEKLSGWEYSVFIFLVINLISFIVIFIGYVIIFLRVKSSMKEMAERSTNTTNEYKLAKKLALIVVTDFICWLPIILIGFASLAGAQVSPQVSAWIAVFILPLNSAVNPLIYTISAIECGKKQTKLSKSFGKSTRLDNMPGSAFTKAAFIISQHPVTDERGKTGIHVTGQVRGAGMVESQTTYRKPILKQAKDDCLTALAAGRD